MVKTTIIDDETYLISKISNTEAKRQFIKFSPKDVPSQLKEKEPMHKILVKSPSKKKYIVWGTENRLYIKKKIFRLSSDDLFKLHFLNESQVEIIGE